MAVKEVDIKVLQAKVVLVTTRKEAVQLIELLHTPKDAASVLESLAGASALTTYEEGVVAWVLLYAPRKLPHVVHEAVHAATAILDSLDVEISAKNDEMLAYSVEHIVEAFWDKSGWQPSSEFIKTHKEKQAANGKPKRLLLA